MWGLNNMLLSNQWVNEDIRGNKKKYLQTNEDGNITFQNLWDAAKAVLIGKVYSNRSLPQETRKISNRP